MRHELACGPRRPRCLFPGVSDVNTAWPNRTFPAPPNTVIPDLHYRIAFLPATVHPEVSGADHEAGVYQVSVFVKAGHGLGPALTKAQAVANHFKRQVLSGISCGVPTLSPPVSEPNWLQIAVSIPFVCL